MAGTDTKADIAADRRHVYGPRPLGAVLPGITRTALRRHTQAAAQVMADWPAIIGPALAAVTTPRRLAAGTLTLACAGPIAIELQHLADQVIARINAHLGSPAVQRLRFIQTAPMAPVAPAPKDSERARDQAVAQAAGQAAEAAVAHLPRGELRDALAALGRAVLAQSLSTPTGG